MAPATMYVTPAGAGTKAGNNWANAMALVNFSADMASGAEAGDVYYLAGGTYSLTADITATADGTTTVSIKIIGVTAGTTNEPPTVSDWATGDDRPLLACGAYKLTMDNYWQVFGIRLTSSNGDYCARADVNATFWNCAAINSSTGSGFQCGGSYASIHDCEAESTSGIAFDFLFADNRLIGCYAHDSATGVLTTGNGSTCLFSIVESNTTGINVASSYATTIQNCTINGNTTGVAGTAPWFINARNNIISGNTDGASCGTASGGNLFDYNDFYNNGTDRTNVTAGNNDIDVDPQFTDAANGDFSIGTNLKAAGFPGAFPGGLSTGYLDIGAVQREEAGGGGWGFRRRPRTVGA